MKFKITAVIIGKKKVYHVVRAPSESDALSWLFKVYSADQKNLIDINIKEVI